MRNIVLSFLLLFVLFVASCVIIDEDEPCFINDTGDLIITNSGIDVDVFPIDIYINGVFGGIMIGPEEELYEYELPIGTYEIEGFYQNGVISKTVYLSQCDELRIELEIAPISTEPCYINNTGNMMIKNVTNSVDSISLDIYINGVFTGATIASGEEYDEDELAAGYYEIEGRTPNGTTFIRTMDLLRCDDLLVELGN